MIEKIRINKFKLEFLSEGFFTWVFLYKYKYIFFLIESVPILLICSFDAC